MPAKSSSQSSVVPGPLAQAIPIPSCTTLALRCHLAGFVVATSSGASTTLPADAGILATGRSYLLTGSSFSLGGIAGSDLPGAALGYRRDQGQRP